MIPSRSNETRTPMKLASPPYFVLPFNSREVGVAIEGNLGLVVFDPSKQPVSPDSRIRLYWVTGNSIELMEFVSPWGAVPSADQARLALHAYDAFLNPSILRPWILDAQRSSAETSVPCDRCYGTGYERTPFKGDGGTLCSFCDGEGVFIS